MKKTHMSNQNKKDNELVKAFQELICYNYSCNKDSVTCTILARDLHELLEIKEPFNDWMSDERLDKLEELGFSWDSISTHKHPVDADKLKKMENDNELNWVSNHELSLGCAKYLLISEPTPKGLAYKNYYTACYYNQTEGHFVTCSEAKDVFHPPFYMRIFMAEQNRKFVDSVEKEASKGGSD
jgi:phage anti-repressor protein